MSEINKWKAAAIVNGFAFVAVSLFLPGVIAMPAGPGATERRVKLYVVCPDGTDNCTPYQPHEVKVVYE